MPKVLLIEDETHLAEPVIRLLTNAGARSVDWAPTAATALATGSSSPFDIVVSDYDLGPGSPNGVAVLTDLRTLHPAATLVCISGAPRNVPDWCTFLDKHDTTALTTIIDRWRAAPT